MVTARWSIPVTYTVAAVAFALAAWTTNLGAQAPLDDLLSSAARLGAGVLYAVSGCIITTRRPENRVGMVMAVVGALLCVDVGAMQRPDLPLWLEHTTHRLTLPVLSYLMLIHPTGRLPSRRAWACAVGVTLWNLAVPVLDMVFASQGEVRALHRVGDLIMTVVLFATIHHIVLSMDRSTRRLYIPAGMAFALCGVANVAKVVCQGYGWELAYHVSRTVYDVGLMLIPVLFLVGVLDSALARRHSMIAAALASASTRDQLEAALRTVLGNPTLTLSDDAYVSEGRTDASRRYVTVHLRRQDHAGSPLTVTFARSPVDWVSPTLENVLFGVATTQYAFLRSLGAQRSTFTRSVEERAARHVLEVAHRVHGLEQRQRGGATVGVEDVAEARREVERCAAHLRRLAHGEVVDVESAH